MTKRMFIFLIVAILSQGIIVAANNLDVLGQQADAAYSKGDFKTAAQIYQQLVEQGVKNSDVYFDLGNAYYQLHDLGHALVNYRRADVFTPRDEDLRLNIERIRVQRTDGIIPEAGILGQITDLTADGFSTTELGWIAIGLLWLCCGLIAAYIGRGDWRKYLRWAILAGVLLFVFVGILTLARVFLDSTEKPAVIVSDTVQVMTGPGTDYVEIFELRAAAEVRVIETRNDWVRFQLPDLREGWIEEKALELI